MAKIGYARETRSPDPYFGHHDLATQIALLAADGCTKIFVDRDAAQRSQLDRCIEHLRSHSDTLVVAETSVLGYGWEEVLYTSAEIPDGGPWRVDLEPSVYDAIVAGDTRPSPSGCVLAAPEPSAEIDDGSPVAGRPTAMDSAMCTKARALASLGVPKTRIAADLGVSRSTLYKAIEKAEAPA